MDRRWLGLLLMMTLFAGVAVTPAWSVSTVHLNYRIEGEQNVNLNYYLSGQGFRLDYGSDERTMSTIYRPDENAFYVLQPEQKQAVKLTEEDVKKMKKMVGQAREQAQETRENLPEDLSKKKQQTLEQMKQGIQRMEQQLNSGNIPEAQKPMMKRMVKRQKKALKQFRQANNIQPSQTSSNASNNSDPEQSTFTEKQSMTWQGMSAKRGVITHKDTRQGTAVILDQPPVSLSESEKQSMTDFFKLLTEMAGLGQQGGVSGLTGSGDLPSLMGGPGDFLSSPSNFMRLAEYRADNHVVLNNWERSDRSASTFRVPEKYTVKRPVEAINSDN